MNILKTLLVAVFAVLSLPALGQFTFRDNGDGTVTITGYTGGGGTIVIPSAINGSPITKIGDGAFNSVTTITNLTIPDSVLVIGENSFAYCTSLIRVVIGQAGGPLHIGINAFYGSAKLTAVTIRSNLEIIADGAFQQCPELMAIYFAGNPPHSVAENAFFGAPVTIYRLTGTAGWGSTLASKPVEIVDFIPGSEEPIVVIPPGSRIATVGGTVSLQVIVRASSPVFLQWRKDGIPIGEATNRTLTLTNVTVFDAGHYDVVVTNAFGTVTSSSGVVQVLPFGAPSMRVNGQIAVGSFSAVSPFTATVTLSGGFTNGFIFYTLDGTTPNLGSTYYTGPFVLTNDARIVAMSLSADLVETSVAPMVTVQILPTYALNKSVIGRGSVVASPLQGLYPSNGVVTLTAYPAPHFVFDHWTGNLTGNANPTTLTMNGPRTVQAVFVPGEYPLTLTASEGGRVTANGQTIAPNTWFPVGGVVSLDAIPQPGWGFVRWEGTVTSTANPLQLPMNNSNEVRAVFGTTTLTIGTPGGGTVTANGQAIAPNTLYPPGTVVTLAAVADNGWSFLRWEGSIASTANPLALRMDQSNVVQAVFGTVVRSAVAGSGTILLNPTNPVPYGTRVTATAVPTAGYAFLAWTGIATGNANPVNFVITNPSPLIGAVFTGPPVPVIVDGPTNQTVVVGQKASFAVTVSGAAPLSYRWRREGNPIVSATNATFAITNVVSADAGNFDVVVSNSFGSATSAVAVLTVVRPPTIAVQPVSQVVAAGDPLTLTVTVDGTEPIHYQWWNERGTIPNATNATLVVNAASTNDSSIYAVVVTNRYGAVTSAVATVTVFIPATISIAPVTQVAPAGGTATFHVEATAYPAPEFQWLFVGKAIPGATSTTLTLTNIGTNVLGTYQVIVWNAFSAVTSAPALLAMSPSLRVPFAGATVVWGKSATLTTTAIGSGDLTYQWFKDGVALPSGTGPRLEFPTVQLTDAGLYSVVVSSQWGSATNVPAQLVVNPANISLAMYAGVTIDGVPGYTYGIQYSTDLRDTNSWTTITNYTLTTPVETWIDFGSTGKVKRFYRVVVP